MTSGRYIGLDLGASSVKAVSVDFIDEKTIELTNANTLPMPEESFSDGNIINYADIASQVLKLIEEGNFLKLPISLAIKSSSTISKYAKLPFVKQQSIEDDVRYMANQYLAINYDDYTIDYRVARIDPTTGTADVIFAAMKKDLLTDYISVIESASQKVEVIDLEALALCNLYNYMKMPAKGFSMILDIGHTDTELIFLKDGIFAYHDMSTASGKYCTDLLKNSSTIPMESVDIVKGNPEAFPSGGEVKNIISEKYLPAVIRDIDSGISKFRMLGGGTPSFIALTGGGASTTGLADKLKNTYKLNVEIMNPQNFLTISSKTASQILESKPASLNIAIAMALR